MTATQEQLENFIGRTLQDSDGEKIGKINDIYLDDATGEPEWIAVNTGLFGSKVSFVPMQNLSFSGDDLCIPIPQKLIKDAPNCEADGSLSQEEEAELYAHYGINYSENKSESGLPSGGQPRRQSADSAMTRSEEEMRVSKQTRESGRARLRKYLVTEQQSVTVPVTHEEIRIEREPITKSNYDAATSGPDLSEDEHEVTLHQEEVVVDKRVVPKERVRLDTETVTEDQQVSADIKKEQIKFEGDENNR